MMHILCRAFLSRSPEQEHTLIRQMEAMVVFHTGWATDSINRESTLRPTISQLQTHIFEAGDYDERGRKAATIAPDN